MGTQDYDSIIAKAKQNKRKKNSSTSSSNGKDYSRMIRKYQLNKTINFDTFESDLKSMNKTLQDISTNWQTKETMNSTRSSVEDMQARINAYQEYQKIYGGADLSELSNSYKSALDNWDNVSTLYSQYKDADSYNVAKKNAMFDEKFKGLTYADVQSKLKEYATDSDEYKYLSGYTNYSDLNDFNQALENATGDYKSKLQKIRNQYALDNKFDLYKHYADSEDFEEKSKYSEKTAGIDYSWNGIKNIEDATYAYINNPSYTQRDIFDSWESDARSWIASEKRIYGLDTPSKDTTPIQEKKGYDRLNEDEIAVYNYIYATEGKEKAQAFLDDMEITLTKRVYDESTKSWKNTVDKGVVPSIYMSILSVPMKIQGAFTGTVEALGDRIEGKEYNPYGYYKSLSNFATDTRKYVSENIAEGTEGMELFGQNIPSFLYDTGMSIADSSIGAATLGKWNSLLMGTSAYQQKAKEMVEAGEDESKVFSTAFASGAAEMVFEYISIDKLLKIKNVDSAASLIKNTLKQAGVEGSEELFTEIANIITDTAIRGKNSELYQMYEDLKSRGYSTKEINTEIAKQVGGQIGWAFTGGALSGGVMGGGASAKNYSEMSYLGENIKGNGRVNDLLDIAQLTPRESEAYNLYTDYAVRNNRDNISNAKLGSLYSAIDTDARNTLSSKKSTLEQKREATETLKKLSVVDEKNTVSKDTINQIDRNIGIREAYMESADELIAAGLESGKDTKSYKLATEYKQKLDNGIELTEKEIANLVKANSEAITAEDVATLSEEDAALFKSVYDGKTDKSDFFNSFELVKTLTENNYSADYILEHKGVLSAKQVSAIYKAKVLSSDASLEKAITALKEKHEGTNFIEGTFDDSVINYDNTNVEGKVNWNSLNSNQKKAIAVLGQVGKRAGMDVELISDGLERGINGAFEISGNKMLIDIYAGMNKVDGIKLQDTIIPTTSHEMTHWMKSKSPELYRKYDNYVFGTLDMGKKTEADRIDEEIQRIKERNKKRGIEAEVTEEEARDEIIARASEDMFAKSEEIKKFLNTLTDSEKKSFVEKVKEILQNVKEWLNDFLSKQKSTSDEAKIIRQYSDRIDGQIKLWDEMLISSISANQALKKEGITGEELAKKVPDSKGYNNSSTQFSDRKNLVENVNASRYNENRPLSFENRASENSRSSINWVYKAKIFSQVENKLFHQKISEINQGSDAFYKNSVGEYMLPIENKIVFTDGNYDSPYISEIVEVLTDYSTDFEKVKERIFNVERGKSDKENEGRIIRQMFGEGFVISYHSEVDGVYEWESGKRKGKTRRTVISNYLRKQDGGRNDTESKETSIKFSDRDTLGNTLTEAQQSYFAESKMRDDDGKLVVMYQGSQTEFFEFDRKKSSPFNLYGRGFYFTDSKSHADQYGDITRAYYLNIKNPISTYKDDNIITKKQLRKYLEVVAENEDYSIENYGTYDIDTILNSVYSKEKSDYAMIQDISATAIGDLVEAIELFNEVNGTSWDGLILNTETIVFNSEQAKLTSNKNPTDDKDIRYSDRDNVSVYERIGETDRLIKENEQLKEDVERLKERLKLERQITNGNHFNENQLNAVAAHIRNIANSNYSKRDLVNLLKGEYSYIATSKDLNWQDVFAKCYDIAKMVLNESKPVTETNDYYKTILKDIRVTKISVNEQQIQNAKYKLGNRWRNAFFNKVNITDNAVSLDTQWQEWSNTYPDLFNAEISDADMLVELYDIYDSVREGSELVVEYDIEEQTRWLAREIYNQYWNVSPIRTTAEKYDKQIKLLNYKHRESMNQLRSNYEDRLKTQHKADRQKAIELVKEIRNRKDKEIAEVKKRSKERMEAYKENAERKTVIQSILSTTTSLNKKLLTNSKETHIPESLKPVVINLINALDFSSKRLLNKNVPTKKDLALEKTFNKARRMADKNISLKEAVWDASKMFTDADNIFSTLKVANDLSLATLDLDLVDKIVGEENNGLLKNIDRLERDFGNDFVLEKMSLDDLKILNAMVKSINHWASQIDKALAISHKEGIANLGKQTIDENDALGEYKEKSERIEGFKKFLSWSNLLPINAFERMGPAAQKVFESLQNAQDTLAFNQDEIEKFTEELFKGKKKDIKKWREDVRIFDLVLPNGKKKTVRMPVSYMMNLYCVAKQEDAMRHLIGTDENGELMNQGGGITIKGFKDKGGITRYRKNTLLAEKLINKITSELSESQKHIADKLQEFMNTKGSEWGDTVSMALYGIKKFGIKNYFPITVTPTTIKKMNTNGKMTTHFFSILNYGFTKSRNLKANQSIEIGDIFDVFTNHMTMMAIYNAFALPIYDMVRWYNFSSKTIDGEEIGVINSLQNAFGEAATSYIDKLITDLNGQHESSRLGFISKIFKNTKTSLVGNSLSVAALQITAYPKAALLISPKYLTKSLFYIKDFGVKKGSEKAKKYCGIALWKSKGNFYVDISKNMSTRIMHNESVREKLIEWSLKGAEKGDEKTWGMLWNACEFEIRDTRKDLKVGSEEFYQTIAKRLREIIYKTQVVDSPLTRSEFMRSPDGLAKSITMFASEMTVAYNIVSEAFTDAMLDVRRNGKKGAVKRNGKKIAKAITIYTVTSAISQIFATAIQAYRDDEKEEKEFEDYLKMYITNFALDWVIIGKLPYIKESLNYAQGYSSSRAETIWMENAFNAAKYWAKAFSGEDEGAARKAIENSLKTLSALSGVAGYNQYRDFMATLGVFGILTKEDFEKWLDEIF